MYFKTTLKLVFVCIAVLSKCCITKAQDSTSKDYTAKLYSLLDLQATQSGYTMLLDSRDLLQVFTERGVSIFDGKLFTSTAYPFKPEQFLTANGISYQANNNLLYQYTGMPAWPSEEIFKGADSFKISSVLQIEKKLWLSFVNKGVYLWQNKQLKKATEIADLNLSLRSANGQAYAISANGYYVLNNSNNTVKVTTPIINSILTGNNEIWIAGTEKVYRIGLIGLTDSISLPFDRKDDYFLCKGKEQNEFYLRINRNNQAIIYKWQNHKWIFIVLLKNVVVEKIIEDKGGNLWVESNSGIYKLTRNFYTKAADNLRLIVYGIDTFGVTRVKEILQKAPLILTTVNIKKLWLSANGDRWAGTSNGLYLLKKDDKKWSLITKEFLPVTEDTDSTMWFSNFNQAAKYKQGQFTYYTLPALGDMPFKIAVNKWHQVFIACAPQLYLLKDNKFIFYHYTSGDNFANDKNGDTWFTSVNTVYQIGRDKNYEPTIKDSIVFAKNLRINFIGFDYHDNLWASTGDGPFHIYCKKNNGRYDNYPGVVFPKINSDLAYRLIEGVDSNMYFTSTTSSIYTTSFTPTSFSSVFSINVDSLLNNRKQEIVAIPKPYITNIKLFHLDINWPSIGFKTNQYGIPVAPVFKSDQNMISFTVMALALNFPETIKYQYQLKGLEENWQPETSINEAVYTNLSPGHYTLLVRAANIYQQWTTPLEYSFIILPPWYQTWWAYTLWGLLAVGFIVIIFYLRLRALRKKDKIDKLLNDQELKALRAQIDPHFLQNSFELIGRRIQMSNIQGTLEALHKVSAYMRKVLYRTDKSTATLEQELDFIQEYLSVQQALLNDSFTYTIHAASQVDLFGYNVPSLLLQPIVENAIKHGINHDNKNGKIEVTITQDHQFIYCCIADSGNSKASLKKEENYQPKGLENAVQRLMLLYKKDKNKPSVNIQPNNIGGHTVTVALPLY